MKALRQATLIFAALLLTGVLPAAAQGGRTSSFEAFKSGFSKDCLERAKEATAGRFREQFVNFCECSVNGTFKELTTTDLLKMAVAGKMPAATEAKLDKVMEACAREHLTDTPAPR